MCGFAGELRSDAEPASAERVARMGDALASRGPDGSGVWADGAVALAHRRLKIIDLTDRAAQPMIDGEAGLAIAYNGAIYNYVELRAELAALGHRFVSGGDTEVILRAYQAWGEACVQRLHGMFAFAIHDARTGCVFLARDRLGIKPLYWARGPGWVRFASTLPALLAGGSIDTELDPIGLQQWLTFHGVVPAPRTILRGVHKLLPATTLTIEADGTTHERAYWSVRPDPDPVPTFADWQALVLDALRRSIRRRLVADVPVGVLLSGGVDSSLLVALMREAGVGSLATFSIGFPSVGEMAGDELPYSDWVARAFATDHHVLRVDEAQTLAEIDDCIAAMSEPMSSHDAIGFYLLAREVARSINVVQTGQGADEIFAGYHWYPRLAGSTDALADYASVFFDRDHAEYLRLVQPAWATADHARQAVATRFAALGSASAVDKALWLDTCVMLVDDPVKRVDNMTMAWGLEARVPFLDHELVELAFRIPAEHKLSGGGKGVLKAVARAYLPAAIVDRPKGYFPVPALTMLHGPILARIRERLLDAGSRLHHVVHRDAIEALLAAPQAHLTPMRGSKLWQLAVLATWFHAHAISP